MPCYHLESFQVSLHPPPTKKIYIKANMLYVCMCVCVWNRGNVDEKSSRARKRLEGRKSSRTIGKKISEEKTHVRYRVLFPIEPGVRGKRGEGDD